MTVLARFMGRGGVRDSEVLAVSVVLAMLEAANGRHGLDVNDNPALEAIFFRQLEDRLKPFDTLRDRLRSMLEKAKTRSLALSDVEGELSDMGPEIEALGETAPWILDGMRGESEKIVNAIAAHHEQVEPLCPEAVLVASAEALSAARPGARREALESYVKRLEKLESVAVSFKGVQKAYAIQAGREIRVIVKQDVLSDAESMQMSRDMARKIEQELTYPGQIKVTVIRESRYVDTAK